MYTTYCTSIQHILQVYKMLYKHAACHTSKSHLIFELNILYKHITCVQTHEFGHVFLRNSRFQGVEKGLRHRIERSSDLDYSQTLKLYFQTVFIGHM